ncbi:MAG: DUF6159 family protein [Bacteroidota bacterium]
MPVADSLICPSCGEKILRTDSQCLGCGAHLDEGRLAGTPTGQPTPAEPPLLEVVLEPAEPTQRGPATPPLQRPPVPYHVDPRTPIWTQLNIPRGRGLGSSLSRGWIFIRQSLSLAGHDSVVIVPSVISTLGGLSLVGLSLLAVYLITGSLQGGHSSGHETLPDVIFAVVGFVATVAGFWFMGMTADLVSGVLRRQPVTLAHAWGEACRNGLALLWLAVITVFVQSLSRRVRHTAPILGDMMGDSIETGWRVASYLLVPIVILEDIPLSQAYGRAVQLHKNNVIGIIVGEIGISWITGLISAVVIIGALIGGFFAYQAMPALLPVLIASAVGVVVIMASAVAYVHMAYYTCLYEWAVASETAGEAVPAPAPLAAALGVA